MKCTLPFILIPTKYKKHENRSRRFGRMRIHTPRQEIFVYQIMLSINKLRCEFIKKKKTKYAYIICQCFYYLLAVIFTSTFERGFRKIITVCCYNFPKATFSGEPRLTRKQQNLLNKGNFKNYKLRHYRLPLLFLVQKL